MPQSAPPPGSVDFHKPARPRAPSLGQRALRSTAVYTAAIALTRAASLVLLPVYTRYLSREQYGILDLLDITMMLCGVLLAVQYAQPMFYFYARAGNDRERAEVVSTAILGSGLLGLIGFVLVALTAPWLSGLVFGSPLYATHIVIAAVTFGLSLVFDSALNWYRITDRAAGFAVSSALRALLQIFAALVALIALRGDLIVLLASGAVAAAVSVSGLLISCYRRLPLRFSMSFFLKLWYKGLPNALSSFSQFVMTVGNRFVVQRATSLAYVGVYALSFKFASALGLLQAAFQYYWAAQIHFIMQRDDRAELISRSFLAFYAWASFLALAVSVFIRPTLAILVTAEFRTSWQYVPLLATAFLFRGGADFYRALFFSAGRFRTDALINASTALASLGLMLLMIPKFGLWGAAISFFITQLIFLLLSAWQLDRAKMLWLPARNKGFILLLYCLAILPPSYFDGIP